MTFREIRIVYDADGKPWRAEVEVEFGEDQLRSFTVPIKSQVARQAADALQAALVGGIERLLGEWLREVERTSRSYDDPVVGQA